LQTRAVLFAACLALLCAGGAAAQSPALQVTDAWVRATPGADVAAAYFTVHNAGGTAVTLSGVRSALAASAMIHESKLDHGHSSMRPHEPLSVAPGATVRLAPGGLHVMLLKLVHPLTPGDEVPLLLLLAGGGTVAVTARVRPLSAD
jgi:copper(I)-binding protein